MTKGQFMIVVGLLVAIVASNAARYVPPLNPRPTFEYAIVAFDDVSLLKKINEAGANGWDLVFARRAVNDKESSYEMIFRRQQ